MSTNLLHRIFDALTRWHLRRRVIAELSALDDRLLKDIGLDRCQLSAVAEDCAAASVPARMAEVEARTAPITRIATQRG